MSLQTQNFKAVFTNHGGELSSLELKGYHSGTDADSPLINLVDAASGGTLALRCLHCNFGLPSAVAYEVVDSNDRSVTFRWDGPQFSLVRKYTVDDERYLIAQDLTLINRSGQNLEGQIGLQWAAQNPPAKGGGFLAKLKGPPDVKSVIYQMAGSVERVAPEKQAQEAAVKGVISWGGVESRYFLGALISRQLSENEGFHYRFDGQALSGTLFYPKMTVRSGDQETVKFSVYTGPKEIHALDATGVGLQDAIDLGWFGIVAKPILHSLKFFHSYLHSWGLSIILLTLLVKLLLNPLTVKGLKSMKGMQKLQPKLAELREKYKGDKQRLNQETMAMFKAHKVNPMGGCLPMLLQMPIYIALYKVLYNSIELYHAPFWFYKDLAAPDPYMVTPILLGVFMVLQQKMTPSASADPTQKKMMMIMPVMFTVFMVFLPMGLVLYILVNTVMTVVQHYMYNHDIRWRDILRGRIKFS